MRLEPLDPERHADDLLAPPRGDPKLWDYLPYGPFADVGELRAWLAERADSTDPLFLAIVDTATGRASGVVSYLRIEPEHGCIEIGHIWFGAAAAADAGARPRRSTCSRATPSTTSATAGSSGSATPPTRAPAAPPSASASPSRASSAST